jgi:hypothetical protein
MKPYLYRFVAPWRPVGSPRLTKNPCLGSFILLASDICVCVKIPYVPLILVHRLTVIHVEKLEKMLNLATAPQDRRLRS